MALGADRYASRADTLVFIGCVLLSVAAMSLPGRLRDPLAQALRQTVLAPFLSLHQQTSLVVTWAHPEFRASAMAADGSVYGIVAPHGTEGPRVWLLELEGVAYRQLVPNGTLILTSGLGGILPRGIPVGVVVGVAGE